MNIDIPKEEVFWTEVYTVLSGMLLFIMLALLDAAEWLRCRTNDCRVPAQFKDEQTNNRACAPMHFTQMLIESLRKLVIVGMGAASTVLVVPCMTLLTECLHCKTMLHQSHPSLVRAPDIEC